MIKYIDGPNGVGKTTLINSTELRTHFTADDPNTFEDYNKRIKWNFVDCYWDRGPIGELIYSALNMREPRITFNEVCDLLISDNIETTIMFDSSFILLANRKSGRDAATDLSLLFIENYLFMDLADRLTAAGVPIYKYDLAKES